MSIYNDIATSYIDCWNETDATARRKAIDALWAEDARYVDPLGDAVGHDAIDATIAAVQERFAGFVFTLTGAVDGHHDQVRFTWELGLAGADAPIAGFDVATTNGDGRLRTVVGFLDRVPSGAA